MQPEPSSKPRRRLSTSRPASHRPTDPSARWAARWLLAALLLLCAGAASAETQTYGAGAGSGELVAIADILAQPEAFDGKSVRVKGEITGVCPKKGCWMELRDGEALLRVKVEDDVIVFPADATGQEAVAQGQVEVRDMTREAYEGWMRHLAEEQGADFDASSIGEGPYRLIQLRGTGAEIGS